MHAKKMQALFDHLDDDVNGCLSLEEFKGVVNDPAVRNWLIAMELDVRDVDNVFQLLDTDEDGCLSLHELVSGVAHLKGAARSIDLCTLLKEVRHFRAEARPGALKGPTSPRGTASERGLPPLFSLAERASTPS